MARKKKIQTRSTRYTKPTLRERIKARIEKSSKGGPKGEWTARKAQLTAQEYEEEGGGYTGKPDKSQKNLAAWGAGTGRKKAGKKKAKKKAGSKKKTTAKKATRKTGKRGTTAKKASKRVAKRATRKKKTAGSTKKKATKKTASRKKTRTARKASKKAR